MKLFSLLACLSRQNKQLKNTPDVELLFLKILIKCFLILFKNHLGKQKEKEKKKVLRPYNWIG